MAMKLVLNSMYSFFEAFGRARAAAHLANQGHHELAKQLMLNDSAKFEVHP
jgi:hypothetical protein